MPVRGQNGNPGTDGSILITLIVGALVVPSSHGPLARRIAVMATLNVVASLGLTVFVTAACGQSSSPPVRWQAQYTQIYSDGFETLQPAVGPGFVLDPAGSLTSDPAD